MRVAALALGSFIAFAVPAQAIAPKTRDEPKVTFDVMNADIVNVIRLLGDVSGKNVVIADDVKGKVTLKLKNVDWRTVLNIVCKSSGCGVVEEDGVLWVAPQARIDADELHALDVAAQRELKGPLFTHVIQVNNANARELLHVVETLLTPRGSATVDERTNTIIVRDIQGSLALRQ